MPFIDVPWLGEHSGKIIFIRAAKMILPFWRNFPIHNLFIKARAFGEQRYILVYSDPHTTFRFCFIRLNAAFLYDLNPMGRNTLYVELAINVISLMLMVGKGEHELHLRLNASEADFVPFPLC